MDTFQIYNQRYIESISVVDEDGKVYLPNKRFYISGDDPDIYKCISKFTSSWQQDYFSFNSILEPMIVWQEIILWIR